MMVLLCEIDIYLVSDCIWSFYLTLTSTYFGMFLRVAVESCALLTIVLPSLVRIIILWTLKDCVVFHVLTLTTQLELSDEPKSVQCT